MAKILNALQMLKDKVANGYNETAPIYLGDMKSNLDAETPRIIENSNTSVTAKTLQYINSENHNRLWNEIEDLMKRKKANVATFPDTDYYTLIDKIRIDLTARRFAYPDLTSAINQERTNPSFSKSITLDEFLPYGAAFQTYGLGNDSVNLIDQKTGDTGSVQQVAYAVGWKDTLENQLYNLDIFKMQMVNDAVARGYTGKRNDLSAGQIVGTTYHATQKQAADATGVSPEDKLYITMDSAIEKLLGLKDPQTGQYIQVPSINCLCNPSDIRKLNRALNGQLNIGGKGLAVNREALSEITNLIPYAGDTIYVGKKTITYAGVTKGKCYLYVPGIGHTLVKRGLTQQIGVGSTLQLSTQELAWYFVNTNYMNEFFGSSNATVLAKAGTGVGYIVEVTLP